MDYVVLSKFWLGFLVGGWFGFIVVIMYISVAVRK